MEEKRENLPVPITRRSVLEDYDGARGKGVLEKAISVCRRAWIGVALFSACMNMLMLAVPLYMLQIYDRVLTTRNIDTLVALTVIVGVAVLVQGILDALRTRVLVRVGNWLDRELGGKVLSASVAGTMQTGSGVNAQGLRDLAQLRGYLGGPAVTPLFDAPWIPVFLAINFLIHPILGWIGVGGALVLLTFAITNDLATRRNLRRSHSAAARALNAADASVRNADSILAMGMRPFLIRRWQEFNRPSQDRSVAALDVSGSISAAARTIRAGLQVAILGTGAVLVIRNEISMGSLIAASIILARGLAPIEQLITSWRYFTTARTAYNQIKKLLESVPGDEERTHLPKPAGHIEVSQVLFIPSGLRNPVLRNVGFTLESGESLGILGQSGSGKTTLARLLVGSLNPSSGVIRLDGADIRIFRDDDRSRFVGYLPQHVELFDGTVHENIARLGDADDKAVIAAAKLAGSHEEILRLPDGYETMIGFNGIPISGGQRQRIGIARAVFGMPSFVVLDEPNSHLDSLGDLALANTLKILGDRGVTVAVVTQRAGILSQLDNVLVMRNGEVASFGPRDSILKQPQRNDNSQAAQ